MCTQVPRVPIGLFLCTVAWWLFIGWVGNTDYGAPPPTYSGNEKHAVQTFTAGGGGGGGGAVRLRRGGSPLTTGGGGGGCSPFTAGGQSAYDGGGGGGQSASGPIPLFGKRYR